MHLTAPPVPIAAPESPPPSGTFSTLPKDVQGRLLEKHAYCNVDYTEWDEFTLDWIKEVGAVLGITCDEVRHATPGSQSDSGAYFVGTYKHAPLARLLIRGDYPNYPTLHRIADQLHAAQPLPYEVIVTVTHSGRSSHEMSAQFECEVDEDSGDGRYARLADEHDKLVEAAVAALGPKAWYEDQCEVGDAVWRTFKFHWDDCDFAEPLRDFMRWAAHQLQAEFDYQTSDEMIIDWIDNNLDAGDIAEAIEERGYE